MGQPALRTRCEHGEHLEFVYLSECYSRRKAAEWQQAFAPVEIVTFDRLSGQMEHLWWLWFDAPGRLREVQ